MPNRIIKESICSSDNIDRLSAFQETVFYRLIVNCDDYGRMDARPKILASRLFPLKDIRAAQMEDALRALTSAELVTLYVVDGKPFLQMKTWDRHQQVRAKRSKYPSPESCLQTSDINCYQMQANVPVIQSESESNPNPKESACETPAQKRKRFAAPTVDEVRAYCTEKGYKIDAQHFVDFYASKGWKVGNAPMKDWQACVRTWVQRDSSQPARANKAQTMHESQYEQREYHNSEDALDRLMEGWTG